MIAFAVISDDCRGVVTVGDGLLAPLAADEQVVGRAGDHLITAIQSAAGSTITVRGGGAAAVVTLATHAFARNINFAGLVPAGILLAANDPDAVSADLGLMLWDPASDTVTDVVTPGGRLTGPSVRSVIVEPSGDLAASPLTPLAGSPSVVAVVDGRTGGLLSSLNLRGEPTSMTAGVQLVRLPAALAGVDSMTGKVLWTLPGDFGLGYATTSAFIVADWALDPDPTFRLVRIDARSGAATVLFSHADDAHWTVWLELSTESAAVVSDEGLLVEATAHTGVASAIAVTIAGGFTNPVSITVP